MNVDFNSNNFNLNKLNKRFVLQMLLMLKLNPPLSISFLFHRFNNVNYEILLFVLNSLNISSSLIDWFSSYLHDRCQRIRVSDSYSNWLTVSSGVPQGGMLSPPLFLVFVNN